MRKYFAVSHNTFANLEFAWIQDITQGLQEVPPCKICGQALIRPKGDLTCILDPARGSLWPDILGCGRLPLFVVSERVMRDWETDGVDSIRYGGSVSFATPVPRALKTSVTPNYYWVDGSAMFDANLDFVKSGFVDVKFCSGCSRRTDNIPLTYVNRYVNYSGTYFLRPETIVKNLFTTDLSPYTFFASDVIVSSSDMHMHLNFRFIPVEFGTNPEAQLNVKH